MTAKADPKREHRARARIRRAALHGAGAGAAERAGANLVAEIVRLAEVGREVASVAGYLPHRDEIDPLPGLVELHRRGHRLCMPVIEARDAPLGFREWAPGAALATRRWGLLEPASGARLTPHVVVVPLLAFDRAGHRLGYGGGFYDRTLAALRAAGPVHAIGFAYAGQEVAAIAAEAWDALLDAIVTEAGVIVPRRAAR